MAKGERVAAAPDEQTASAGKIQLLDLGALKERIGAKWDRMSGPVQAFFEAAIRRNLGQGDIFYRSGELAYLVVFRGLSAAETELKCAVIAEEVCQRLFGANGESVTLRSVTGHVAQDDLPRDASHVGGLDALLERNGREVLVSKTAAGIRRSNAPQAAERELRVRLINQASGLQRIKASDVAFAYRPVWDCAKHAVLTYLCQPALGPLPTDADLATAFLAAEDAEDLAFLDLLVLEQCGAQLKRLRLAGLRVVLAVPVHFTTLSRVKSWQAYSAAYRQIPKDRRPRHGLRHLRNRQRRPAHPPGAGNTQACRQRLSGLVRRA